MNFNKHLIIYDAFYFPSTKRLMKHTQDEAVSKIHKTL